MTAARGVIAGSESAAREAAPWAAVRADASIQYAPVPPPPKPPATPEWLLSLSRFFEELLRPLGQVFGLDWRWLMWLLIALAAIGAVWLLWELVLRPLIAKRRAVAAQDEAWTPGQDEALALLEDADRLAAAGRFGEAAHLLLQRSVGQIAAVRPGWLAPASTSREIGSHGALPQRAREAFAAIAEVVERSRFALREAGEADWRQARSAYADFALSDLRGNMA